MTKSKNSFSVKREYKERKENVCYQCDKEISKWVHERFKEDLKKWKKERREKGKLNRQREKTRKMKHAHCDSCSVWLMKYKMHKTYDSKFYIREYSYFDEEHEAAHREMVFKYYCDKCYERKKIERKKRTAAIVSLRKDLPYIEIIRNKEIIDMEISLQEINRLQKQKQFI